MTKSTKIPKGFEERYAELADLTDRFCEEHLMPEYAELARYAIAALCRKRPSPLNSGRPNTWACAVLYALGQANFLHDKASKPYMAMADLCGHFGIGASTGGNKAKLVRDVLGIRPFDHTWTLPSRVGDSPIHWMIQVNGLVLDARTLPEAVQEAAVAKGLIPFVYPTPDPEAYSTVTPRPPPAGATRPLAAAVLSGSGAVPAPSSNTAAHPARRSPPAVRQPARRSAAPAAAPSRAAPAD